MKDFRAVNKNHNRKDFKLDIYKLRVIFEVMKNVAISFKICNTWFYLYIILPIKGPTLYTDAGFI